MNLSPPQTPGRRCARAASTGRRPDLPTLPSADVGDHCLPPMLEITTVYRLSQVTARAPPTATFKECPLQA